MFGDLIAMWKQVYLTHKEGKINTVMYWYLVFVLVVVGGLFMYLYWEGCIGIMILFNGLIGVPTGMSFNILKAIGLVLIIRYALLSGIDAAAKRTPANITERLTLIEDKVNSLHRLAFYEDEEDAEELRKKEIKKREGEKNAKEIPSRK